MVLSSPKEKDCTNLLVPGSVSSGPIAFGYIRMEPVFMILRQSAAVPATLAIDKKCAVRDVAYDELKTALDEKKRILAYQQ